VNKPNAVDKTLAKIQHFLKKLSFSRAIFDLLCLWKLIFIDDAPKDKHPITAANIAVIAGKVVNRIIIVSSGKLSLTNKPAKYPSPFAHINRSVKYKHLFITDL
jgi:hypothetical protein